MCYSGMARQNVTRICGALCRCRPVYKLHEKLFPAESCRKDPSLKACRHLSCLTEVSWLWEPNPVRHRITSLCISLSQCFFELLPKGAFWTAREVIRLSLPLEASKGTSLAAAIDAVFFLSSSVLSWNCFFPLKNSARRWYCQHNANRFRSVRH